MFDGVGFYYVGCLLVEVYGCFNGMFVGWVFV